MSKSKPTDSANAKHADRAEDNRASAEDKDKKQSKPLRDGDLPGAEGPLSAGANEDTYD